MKFDHQISGGIFLQGFMIHSKRFLQAVILCMISHVYAWELLEPGLELGSFQSPMYHDSIDAPVRVLRIDPDQYELRLLNASDPRYGRSYSAAQWCKQAGLVAAINASMYQTDYKTSVSYMRTSLHVNNPRLSRDKAILAFDRRVSGIKPVMIIDRQCDNFDSLKNHYGSYIQNIRMISCYGKNVWSKQPEKWSVAAIGIDTRGRILYFHVSAPHTVHDFANIILRFPLSVSRAMYVEGGSEAQMSVHAGGKEFSFVGEYTGYGYSPSQIPSIPNVVGVVKKSSR